MFFNKITKKYKSIIKAIPLPTVVHVDGTIVDTNKINLRKHVLGKNINYFIPKESQITIDNYISKVIHENKVLQTKAELYFKERYFNCIINSSCYRTFRKNYIITTLKGFDLSENKYSNNLFSKISLNSIIDKIILPVIIIDPLDSKILELNNAASVFFDNNKDQLKKMFFVDLVNNIKEETLKNINSASKDQRKYAYFKHCTNPNITKYSKAYFSAIIYNKRKLLYIHIEDITSNISSNRMAVAKHKEFDELMNNIPVGVFKTNINGHLIDYNTYFHILFGFKKPKEFEKQFLKVIKFNKLINRIITRHLISNQNNLYTTKLSIKLNDNKIINVSITLYLHFNQNVPECYGIISDITEEINKQNQIINNNKLLEDKVRSRTDKLESVNQELKNEIIKRQKVQNELIKAKDFFFNLVNQLPDPVFYYDKRKSHKYVNLAFLKTFGPNYTDNKRLYTLINSENNRFNQFEQELINKQGIKRCYLTKMILVPEKGSNIKLGIFRDITDRKKVETKLKNSEIKFKSLVKSSPNGIFVCNEHGRIEIYNDPLIKLLNIPPTIIINKYLWDIATEVFELSKAYLPKIRRKLKLSLKKGNVDIFAKNGRIETYLITTTGNKIYLEIHLFFVNINNKFLLTGIIRDVTTKKNHIQRIKKTNQKLQTVFHKSMEIFVVLDFNHNVSYFNRQASLFFKDVHKTQIKNKLNFYSLFEIKEDKKAIEEALNDFNTNRKRNLLINIFDKWYNYEINLINKSDYNNDKFFINIQDYTNIKKQEESLIKLIKQEKDLNNFKNGILSIVSHEFKTPLSSININSQIIQNNLNHLSSGDINKHFHRIYKSTNLINKLINDITFYRKNQEQLTPLSFEEFDIFYFINEIINHLKFDNYINKNFKVHNKLVSNVIKTDKKYLHYIISNLVSNALKFSNKEISLSLSNIFKTHIAITLIDDGIGIHKNEIPKVFDPFYRGSNINSIQGSGLGMSIVLLSINALKGTIDIESTINKGTKILITIPNSIN